MAYIYDKIKRCLQDSDGATVVEYGVLIALIIAVSIGVIIVLGDRIEYLFSLAAEKIGGGTGP